MTGSSPELEAAAKWFLSQVPEVGEWWEENTDLDDGRILAYLFFSDVTLFVQAQAMLAATDTSSRGATAAELLRRLLSAMETLAGSHDDQVLGLVATSFVECIDDRHPSRPIVTAMLGPRTRSMLDERIRS